MTYRISLALLVFAVAAHAQRAPQPIPSLKRVEVPKPANLSTYVRDQTALIALGKALFWDMQLGSDGKVACATCHFHAGADHRLNNQLSGARGAFPLNYRLTAADFPFHQMADPNNRASQVLRDSNYRAGSAGMFARKFDGLVPGLSGDEGADVEDATFRAAGANLRQVGDRNAPSVLNAVYYFRNFWDGRASDTFTGATPFGLSDTSAKLLSSAGGSLKAEPFRLEKSSLASQSVGPVLNLAEMSYNSRSWPRVGKKMLPLRPLANQRIATDDSVLGRYANPRAPGFPRGATYLDLVKAAFQPAYWDSSQAVDGSGSAIDPGTTAPDANRFTQAEFNFSLFFGVAIQAYESTLISDDTPLDRFAEGQITALTNPELAGMQLFTGRTGCAACHSGAEFSLATHTGLNSDNPLKAGGDTGYFHIGARPIADDLGLGGLDGFGKPLARSFPVDDSPATARGRFKTPGLRNIEFTGPYFHNGGQATLRQVMEFYNRGGDFPVNPTSGPDIRPLNLSAEDQSNLVSFMKALSDERV
ncbi:MAG TPA: cytochrome c peroxidase, partial [Bryobacteraceae bacterium]|nr:cytochrome c peroxidase [Bryobacteraceae bacterium]